MYFKQYLHDDLGCSSYLIASRQSREAAVVDPQFDIGPYVDLCAERHYTITTVIDTHLHADHVSGNRRLTVATGARLYLHESAAVAFPFEALRGGEVLTLGQVKLEVVHTPGHRPEAISLVVTNPPRSPEPSMILSGDTLFVGDVGRPDFGGREGARQQYESVQKLLSLKDYVEVFPAHFEGSCGKAMCGRPSSTIGFERRFNPVLRLTEAEFLKLTAEAPPRPLNMAAILDTNRGLADHSWLASYPHKEASSIGVEEAREWLARRNAFVLDVREPAEYAAFHIPGAVCIPQAELALRLGEVPRDRDVLIVCASGSRSFVVGGFLAGMGYNKVVNLAGGTNGWKDARQPVEPRQG